MLETEGLITKLGLWFGTAAVSVWTAEVDAGGQDVKWTAEAQRWDDVT